ncbi:uncharacterized protein ISCGN_003667 [Ixodes scapularis]
MVKALVVSRVCYGARHYWLARAQWQKLEALNNQAKGIIASLPKFCPLGKLNEHAQINSLHETVIARTVAHGERLKHTRQGRRILELLLRCTGDLPKLPQELLAWEDRAEITDNKPRTRKGDKKQQDRLARAHIKMAEAWEEVTSGIVAAYTDTASIDGPVTLKTAAVIFPTLDTSATKNLSARTSIKMGELAAVRLALETALAVPEPPPEHLRIFTDSRKVVKECRKSRSPSVEVRNIEKLASLLLERGTTMRIAWVPAHAGIPGNEEVHRLARASLVIPHDRDDTPSLQEHDHGYAPVRDRAPVSRAREEDYNDEGYDPGEARAQINILGKTTPNTQTLLCQQGLLLRRGSLARRPLNQAPGRLQNPAPPLDREAVLSRHSRPCPNICLWGVTKPALRLDLEAVRSQHLMPHSKICVWRHACSGDHNYSVVSPRQHRDLLRSTRRKLQRARKLLKQAKKKVNRKTARIKKLNVLLRELRRRLPGSAVNIVDIYTDTMRNLVLRRSRKPKNMYAEDVRKFALTVHFYSAKAYKFLRKHVRLLHASALRKWAVVIDGNPGFTRESFNRVTQEVQKGRLLVSLMVDEMSIKKQVDWDGKEVIGYCDLGHGILDNDCVAYAKHALVFLAVAVNKSWKIPLGCALIDGLHGNIRANLVRQYITKLEEAGAECISVTCDGTNCCNISMLTALGVCFAPPLRSWFPNPSDPSRRVYGLLDACHMLKLMHNLLAEKQCIRNGAGRVVA